jgi:hypothetical protein
MGPLSARQRTRHTRKRPVHDRERLQRSCLRDRTVGTDLRQHSRPSARRQRRAEPSVSQKGVPVRHPGWIAHPARGAQNDHADAGAIAPGDGVRPSGAPATSSQALPRGARRARRQPDSTRAAVRRVRNTNASERRTKPVPRPAALCSSALRASAFSDPARPRARSASAADRGAPAACRPGKLPTGSVRRSSAEAQAGAAATAARTTAEAAHSHRVLKCSRAIPPVRKRYSSSAPLSVS